MRKTSPPGISRGRTGGYVLIEALAALFVLAVGAVSLLAAVNSGMKTVLKQRAETIRIIEARNARAMAHMDDPLTLVPRESSK